MEGISLMMEGCFCQVFGCEERMEKICWGIVVVEEIEEVEEKGLYRRH